jgi:hypothetical protein
MRIAGSLDLPCEAGELMKRIFGCLDINDQMRLSECWRSCGVTGMNEECGSGFDEVYMLSLLSVYSVDLLTITLFNMLLGCRHGFPFGFGMTDLIRRAHLPVRWLFGQPESIQRYISNAWRTQKETHTQYLPPLFSVIT